MFGALFFERLEAEIRLREFRFGRGHAPDEFGGTFFIGADASLAALGFQGDLAQAIAILAGFGFDGVAALGALGMLGLGLLHALGEFANFGAKPLHLAIERHALGVHDRELAGEHNPQLGAHFVAQAAVALGLAGLAFERIHLARDFFEDVIDAVEILFRLFEAGFGEALFGFEFRDAGGLFDDVAAVGGTAA